MCVWSRSFAELAFLAGCSLIGSLAAALLYVAVLHASLSPTDAAYGQGLGQVLSDPFVLQIGGGIALLAAALGFLLSVLCLRGRNLGACAVLVLSSVALVILVVTPFSLRAGFIGSFVALFAAMIYCRHSRAPWIRG